MRTLTSKELGEKFTTMVESGGGGVEGRKKNAIESQNTFTHTHYSKKFFFAIPFFINQCLLSSKHWTDTIFFWQNTSQEAHNLNCIKKLQQRSYLLLDKGFLMDIRETQIYKLHTLLIHHFFLKLISLRKNKLFYKKFQVNFSLLI